MTADRDALLDVIEDLVSHGCVIAQSFDDDGPWRFEHQGLSAYEDALRLLAEERPGRWRLVPHGATLDRSA